MDIYLVYMHSIHRMNLDGFQHIFEAIDFYVIILTLKARITTAAGEKNLATPFPIWNKNA